MITVCDGTLIHTLSTVYQQMMLAPRIQTLVIYYVIVGKNILEFIVVLEIDAALQL